MAQPNTSGGSMSAQPAIIRVVPGNCRRIMIDGKRPVRTLVVKRPVPPKPVSTVTSSPTTNLADAPKTPKIERLLTNGSMENMFDELPEENLIVPEARLQSAPPVQPVKLSRIQALKRSIEQTIDAIPTKINRLHDHNCCGSCRETLNVIVQQQQEILKHLRTTGPPAIAMERRLDLLPPMPFNDLNDFLDFDESLINENVQTQFVYKLFKLMVSIEIKSISNVMGSILTNELCKSISWIGIKNTHPFSETNMVSLIVDVIQDHHQLDIDVIQSRIAEWLRRCGDRINNELRKKNKKKDGLALRSRA
ncbi:hypothetical protein QAD02_007941 [Eretmocerus hayati]|uniref:Uncharacterized protein n=1 Tax=Eretmocerus hayati TaxID=131215 RepID=A0ACC2N560_9HYME|nr:hypothetical protein QAD02_007941 [Eretmocerus hayati]